MMSLFYDNKLQYDCWQEVVVQVLLIYCFMYLPLFVGVLCCSLFWYALL